MAVLAYPVLDVAGCVECGVWSVGPRVGRVPRVRRVGGVGAWGWCAEAAAGCMFFLFAFAPPPRLWLWPRLRPPCPLPRPGLNKTTTQQATHTRERVAGIHATTGDRIYTHWSLPASVFLSARNLVKCYWCRRAASCRPCSARFVRFHTFCSEAVVPEARAPSGARSPTWWGVGSERQCWVVGWCSEGGRPCVSAP